MDDEKLKWYFFLCIGFILLLIDLAIKWSVNQLLPFQQETQSFLPNVTLYLTHNRGYHYLLGEIPHYRIFNIVALVLALVFTYFLIKDLRATRKSRWQYYISGSILALLIGAMANPLEALFTGKVTDWFIFHPFPWPSNLADQFVNGIIYILFPLMIIEEVIRKSREKKKRKEAAEQKE